MIGGLKFKESNMSENVNDNHAAIAVLCRDGSHHHYNGDYYDYVIAIFEGASLGDAIMQFAGWRLEDATMNLDGAWRSSPKMRKFAREWYFPPVPRGFDFAAVEPQARNEKKDFYSTRFAPEEDAFDGSHYYSMPYEKQFAHFVGLLKHYGEQAEMGEDIKGRVLPPPYPYLLDDAWRPSHGFDPQFAYTPYFTDYGIGFFDEYEIFATAVGVDAVARLKSRYSGIDCENIEKGLREAYEKGEFHVFNQYDDEPDVEYTRIEVRGMLFTRYIAWNDPDVRDSNEYGWQMNLRLWPKNTAQCFWHVDFDGEDILDRMVLGDREIEYRSEYAKWWLKHKRKPRNPSLDDDPFSIDDLILSKRIDPKSKEWLTYGRPLGTQVAPSGGRDSARMPNLQSSNPSFAALLIKHVRDRFANDAPSIYRRAHVSRKTYSAIVSNELRAVSKQTAIMFALALCLPYKEAEVLLEAAGFALSNFILEDVIIKSCFGSEIYELDRVNEILLAHHAKPLLCQE